MDMETLNKNILALKEESKKLYAVYDDDNKIIEEINKLSKDRIKELIDVYSNPKKLINQSYKIASSANIVRYIILRKLQSGEKITISSVEQIKKAFIDKDLNFFKPYLDESTIEKINEYSKNSPFEKLWDKYFSLLHPFVIAPSDFMSKLKQLTESFIHELELSEYKSSEFDFTGARSEGSPYAWFTIFPKKLDNHNNAYRLTCVFQREKIITYLDAGRNNVVKNEDERNVEKVECYTYQEVLEYFQQWKKRLIELNESLLKDSGNIGFFKLGVHWGSDKQSFLDLLTSYNIVIGHQSKYKYAQGDIVLIADGMTAIAIAEVLNESSPITDLNLKEECEKYAIDYNSDVLYSKAKIYILSDKDKFQYKLQQGICRINDDIIKNKIMEILSLYKGGGNMNENDIPKIPLNQILYGPPGTGKTYSTIDEALKIIDYNFWYQNQTEDKRPALKEKFNSLVDEGQIVFTSFHQSMSYEDFVEGIKPIEKNNQVIYEIKKGVFKEICKRAKENTDISRKAPDVQSKQEWVKNKFKEFKNTLQKQLDSGNDVKVHIGKLIEIDEEEQKFYYLQNKGSNRYMSFSDIIQAYMDGAFTNKDMSANKNLSDTARNPGLVSYYSFMAEEFKKSIKEQYVAAPEGYHVQKLCNYVLIIDEINRGNVSNIFGELITLIEEDKRQGKDEALEAMLPYSKEKFSVPPNLYIIGTMNTADRSVEALDTALRRRFSFQEIMPNPDLIKPADVEGINLPELLRTINARIEKLLDKDHLIGHSYFLNIKTLDDLRKVFENKIIPLLQEYFFGDYGKIGLILGKAFVEKDETDEDFAAFEYGDSQPEAKEIYKIKEINNTTVQDFKSVYEKSK